MSFSCHWSDGRNVGRQASARRMPFGRRRTGSPDPRADPSASSHVVERPADPARPQAVGLKPRIPLEGGECPPALRGPPGPGPRVVAAPRSAACGGRRSSRFPTRHRGDRDPRRCRAAPVRTESRPDPACGPDRDRDARDGRAAPDAASAATTSLPTATAISTCSSVHGSTRQASPSGVAASIQSGPAGTSSRAWPRLTVSMPMQVLVPLVAATAGSPSQRSS